MDYLAEPLSRYLDDAAASKPTPGGGSVAALAGALASTMASMAANFTSGKEKFKDVQPQIERALARLGDARSLLLDLAHRDMDAYAAIMAAWRLPKDSAEEKALRSEAIREATKSSLGVVEGVLGASREVIEVARGLADTANPNLVSDVGVAAELALGAVRSAIINAEVNLSCYKDAADAATVRGRVESGLKEAERLAGEVRGIVLGKLRG